MRIWSDDPQLPCVHCTTSNFLVYNLQFPYIYDNHHGRDGQHGQDGHHVRDGHRGRESHHGHHGRYVYHGCHGCHGQPGSHSHHGHRKCLPRLSFINKPLQFLNSDLNR